MKKFSLIFLAALSLLAASARFSYSADTALSPPVMHRYIKVKELRSRLIKGEHLFVLDARSSYAYGKEHIKGALSLPLPEIRTRVASLPISKTDLIVTYCSCPHHIAEMASDVLKQLEYTNVYVLDEGLPGWLKLGYPLEGELANKPVRLYWVIGYVHGPFHRPAAGMEVRAYQAGTDQLEIEKTGNDGFYAMPLRFYGLQPGNQLQVALGRDTLFFTVGKTAKPWGIRIDDEESHIVLRQNDFLKTFKSRKLHVW